MNKIIITITSGLGNQMYQYALFYSLIKQQKKASLFCYNKYLNQHNGLEINTIFKNVIIPKNKPSDKFHIALLNFVTLVNKVFEKLRLSNYLPDMRRLFKYIVIFPDAKSYVFNKEVFSDLKNNIFLFPEITDNLNKKIYENIISCESVSIHVRRGDYIHNPINRVFHGDVCDISYYRNAINYIEQHIKKPVYFIFSDDPEWCKDNLSLKNVFYINHNSKDNSFRDMQLMASCKHNIIANSTFSAWAALLNNQNNNIVIAPEKWINNIYDKSKFKLSIDSWIFINNNFPSVSLIFKHEFELINLNNILKQSFNDFELLCLQDSLVRDNRIKNIKTNVPMGKVIFEIDCTEIIKFNDNQYLIRKLINHYKSIN